MQKIETSDKSNFSNSYSTVEQNLKGLRPIETNLTEK